MTIKTIEKNILRLSPAQRLHLVGNILDTLREPDPAVERAWGKESDKRLASYKSGKAKGTRLEAIKKSFAR